MLRLLELVRYCLLLVVAMRLLLLWLLLLLLLLLSWPITRRNTTLGARVRCQSLSEISLQSPTLGRIPAWCAENITTKPCGMLTLLAYWVGGKLAGRVARVRTLGRVEKKKRISALESTLPVSTPPFSRWQLGVDKVPEVTEW